MLAYVDDIIVTGNIPTFIKSLFTNLNSEFSLKDLGNLHYFLGIEVRPQPNGALFLTQSKYIRDLLGKTKMDETNPISSPMVGGCKLSKLGYEPFPDPTLYTSIVGALQYATDTGPEISFSINKVCPYMSDPSEQHWAAVKRILRYLASTIKFGLKFLPPSTGPPFTEHAYCDADWASDPDNRRSTSGAAIFSRSNLVSWRSKKQPVVERSSTEAEYRSLVLATAGLGNFCLNYTFLITLQSSFVTI